MYHIKKQIINRKDKTFTDFDGKTKKYYDKLDVEMLRDLEGSARQLWIPLRDSEDCFTDTFFCGSEQIKVYFLRPRHRTIEMVNIFRFDKREQKYTKKEHRATILSHFKDSGIECWEDYTFYPG
jgi:hypothetical protein